MPRNMVSPSTNATYANGTNYQTAAPGLVVLNVPEADAQILLGTGWRDARAVTNNSPTQLARSTPIDDVAGNFTAGSYAGIFPAKNVEDALAQLAARLTAGHL